MNDDKKLSIEDVVSLMHNHYELVYLDYRDNLNGSLELFQECLDNKSPDTLFEKISDWFNDYEAVEDILSDLRGECKKAGYGDNEIHEFFFENRDLITEEIRSRDNTDYLKELLMRTREIPVRVELHSNFDCMNSFWFESQGGLAYEQTYFGAVVDLLKLNPAKVKRQLQNFGVKVCGRYPNLKWREDQEHVDYEAFYQELTESCAPANLFTFVAKVNALELYESGFNVKKITIPKGNTCGFFSSFSGGGSTFDLVLDRDMTIKLNAKQYDYMGVAIDCDEYNIRNVYGTDSGFFGRKLAIAA